MLAPVPGRAALLHRLLDCDRNHSGLGLVVAVVNNNRRSLLALRPVRTRRRAITLGPM
jgi:hypothetical protein